MVNFWTDFEIPSSIDGKPQAIKAHFTEKKGPVPLLVILHQWSSGVHDSTDVHLVPFFDNRPWSYLMPDFRGANVRPEACASPLAIQDVLDAVAWACQNHSIDEKQVMLLGGSGGAHMALIMAGHAPPGLAAGFRLGALLRSLHLVRPAQRHGPAGKIQQKLARYLRRRARSPRFHLHKTGDLPMEIQAGIHDGHTGSVPIDQTLMAFNAMAKEEDRISDAQMEYFVQKEAVPPELAGEVEEEERVHQILFRRSSNNARVTIFEGGHDMDTRAALNWLSAP